MKAPPDLFEDIIGYTDLKELIIDTIENYIPAFHWFFWGPPACAKSMFMDMIEEKLPGARLISCSNLSKPGLRDMLLREKPRFLLLDELERAPESVHDMLIMLLEKGRMIVLYKSFEADVHIKVTAFATANRLDRVAPEVLSRFEVLEFPEYTKEEFMNICRGYVARRQGITVKLAEYIGNRVWNHMDIQDIREVVRIARLAKTRKKADLIIRVFSKYKGISPLTCRDCGREFYSSKGLNIHIGWSNRLGGCRTS